MCNNVCVRMRVIVFVQPWQDGLTDRQAAAATFRKSKNYGDELVGLQSACNAAAAAITRLTFLVGGVCACVRVRKLHIHVI